MIKPVKRISPSEKDAQSLLAVRARKTIKQQDQPADYANKVVVKPWGHEFMIFKNECVAIWLLTINKDHATSMHCHPSKRTALAILTGKALCNTFRHRNFLSAGDSLILDATVFHSTKALSLDGVSLFEMETPPDKVDLLRLRDGYGREDSGYEGSSGMVTKNLDDYRYFHFDEKDCRAGKFTVENLFSVSLDTYSSTKAFQKAFVLDPGSLYCVCKGALLGPDKSTVVGIGEIERGTCLQQLGSISIDQATVLMKFAIFS